MSKFSDHASTPEDFVIICFSNIFFHFIYCRNKKDCQWSPIDFSTDEPVRRHFMAQFSSEQAALEFKKFVEEVSQ